MEYKFSEKEYNEYIQLKKEKQEFYIRVNQMYDYLKKEYPSFVDKQSVVSMNYDNFELETIGTITELSEKSDLMLPILAKVLRILDIDKIGNNY